MTESGTENAVQVLAGARRFLEDLAAMEGNLLLVPAGAPDSAQYAANPVGTSDSAQSDDLPVGAPDSVQSDAQPPGASGPDRLQDLAADVPERGNTADRSAGKPGAGTPGAGKTGELEVLRRTITRCERCGLCHVRNRLVFGSGAVDAGILFVGEAPGVDEDRQGEPFVGAAGQLLTRIIQSMQLRRDEVYIANVLKCHPPGNRDPKPEEIAACEPFLQQQVQIVQPRIICALGRIAAQSLLQTDASLTQLRGSLHEYAGIPVICTYHPSALLRDATHKRPTWEDVKWLRREYDGTEL